MILFWKDKNFHEMCHGILTQTFYMVFIIAAGTEIFEKLWMLKYKVGLQASESWSQNKLTAIALMKQTFNAAGQIFWTLFTVPMLKVLNLNTVGFRQYSKKYCNLHIAFILGSSRCSELNWVSLLTEFSWVHFLNKDLKTLYWQLYWSNWNVCIINIWQLCES